MEKNSSILDPAIPMQLGEKHFLDEDQLLFSRLSGDCNPMHMDEMAARRLLAGQKVVHGIHLLLWALEYWFLKNTETLQSVKCDFKNPVHVGKNAVFFQEKINDKKSIIRVYVDDLLCLKIVLLHCHAVNDAEEDTKEIFSNSGYELLGNVSVPFDRDALSQKGKKYKVALPESGDKNNFPGCRSRFGDSVFSAFCSLSFFVGMVCPGLHSLFSTLNINLPLLKKHDPYLFYAVDNFDSRFELFYISVSGVIAGEITAFQRPAPVRQVSLASMSSHVKPHEFANTQSLIIGGSRGLGEHTAKLLVAGGGDVILTYSQGLQDAQRVNDEINNFRHGACKIKKFNVIEDAIEVLIPDDIDSLTAIYFFATPKIFRKKSELFDHALFNEFFSMYVSNFYSLCAYFEKACKHPVKIFLPSSVAVTEKSSELAEYAMAKLASEYLAEEINRSYQHVSVIVSRLPRLETDQTATISKVAVASTLDIMLPLIRAVNKS